MQDELKAKLIELELSEAQVGLLDKQGAKTAEDMAMLNAEQVQKITKCGLVTAMKIVAAFVPAPCVPDQTDQPADAPNAFSTVLLPQVPLDDSFLAMLKTGGVLKIDTVDVISAVRAALASQVGLYGLPDVLLAKMEQFANEQDEPVGESFYALQKLIVSRNYADVLSAFGASGQLVSQARKNEVLVRLHDILWPELRGFHETLVSWMQTWATAYSNPGAMMAAMTMLASGQKGMMPPGMMQQPDTAGLRDAAEGVINRINKVFAGTGIPVARALAYDAMRIKHILDEPTLPAATGSATKDQMLKSLGINVGSDYVRLEANLVQFALAVMVLPTVSAGNEETAYLGGMLQLGGSIPWEKLDQPVQLLRGRSRRTSEEEGGPEGEPSFRSR